MSKNMRKLVRSGYDDGRYDEIYARKNMSLDSFETFILGELVSHLDKSAKILDLGCGVGLPFDGWLVKKGFDITGVDISQRHIDLAKKNVPKANFVRGDFFTNKITGKFDAIISLYAIFHIPRTEHKKLLKSINSRLNKNGLILLTLGADSMRYDLNKDFVGAPMAWSSYSLANNRKIVLESGFDIIFSIEDNRTEHHLWVLARKK